MENTIMNIKESGFKNISNDELNKIMNFCDEYIEFLNMCKTERETCNYIVDRLKENGFENINTVDNLKANDKVYMINRNKTVYAIIIGDNPIEEGINFIGSHIDSPRLDLKPNPLYEDAKLALFKTHYYGGIKKYQWTTIPLEIRGVIAKINGDLINVSIGKNKEDPIFTISDLLPHLSKEQYDKKLGKAIEGEDLNIIVGSIPQDNNSIKENIMKILNKKYNITEIDFNSAELEIVPLFDARSSGFDNSMIAAYGHDDRVCAYTSLKALLNLKNSKKSAVCIFSDKEEIGSVGNTGMCSNMIDLFINEVLNKLNVNKVGLLNKIYCNSCMLSADVGAGVDPNNQSVSEINNASYIGYGVEINKYTGSGGKSGASDANAEYLGKIRSIFNKNNIKYQISELGKVDLGGGGTIAYILANKGMEVVDCGVAVISMHSPYELVSKYDVYSAYKAYSAFYKDA